MEELLFSGQKSPESSEIELKFFDTSNVADANDTTNPYPSSDDNAAPDASIDEFIIKTEPDTDTDPPPAKRQKTKKELEEEEREKMQPSISECSSPASPMIDTQRSYCTTALFFSGKYFKIVQQVPKTGSITAACHSCRAHIKGKRGISSNFLTHLKNKHPAIHEVFMAEKARNKQFIAGGYARKTAVVYKKKYQRQYLEYQQYQEQQQWQEQYEQQHQLLQPQPEHQQQQQSPRLSGLSNGTDPGPMLAKDICSPFFENEEPLHKKVQKQQQQQQNHDQQNHDQQNHHQQPKLTEKLLAYVSTAMLPLTIVANHTFRNLFEGTGLELPSPDGLAEKLNSSVKTAQALLSEQLRAPRYFCTTVDIWTANHSTFFGYTIHWIAEDFQRECALLQCRRLRGVNYRCPIELKQLTDDINAAYGLDGNRIMRTVINNGTNFMQIFRRFGLKGAYKYVETDEGIDEDTKPDDKAEMHFHNPANEMPFAFNSVGSQLNELWSTDLLDCVQEHIELHLAAIARCENVWRKCLEPKYATLTASCLGSCLRTPLLSSWYTLYAALKHLLQYKDKLAELCRRLQTAAFSNDELDYLEELVVFMEPIANALDFLRNEEHNYFGYFLPTIVTLKVKYEKLHRAGQLIYLQSACNSMLAQISFKFRPYFELRTEAYGAVVAAVTCPTIKTKFLTALQKTAGHFTEEKLVDLMVNLGKKYATPREKAREAPNAAEFFDFDEVDKDATFVDKTLCALKQEVYSYLQESVAPFESLERFRTIKNLFYKYNTTLTTSAPVARLLCFVDVADAPGHHHLSDDVFRDLVLYKSAQHSKFKLDV